jgi:hypothetical protein
MPMVATGSPDDVMRNENLKLTPKGELSVAECMKSAGFAVDNQDYIESELANASDQSQADEDDESPGQMDGYINQFNEDIEKNHLTGLLSKVEVDPLAMAAKYGVPRKTQVADWSPSLHKNATGTSAAAPVNAAVAQTSAARKQKQQPAAPEPQDETPHLYVSPDDSSSSYAKPVFINP